MPILVLISPTTFVQPYKKNMQIFFRTKTYKIPSDLQTKHLNAKINIKISNFSSFLGIMVFVIWSRLDNGS